MEPRPAALENDLTPKQKAFLAAYGRCARINQAAETAKCNKQSHYNWLQESEAYRQAFNRTQTMIGDLAEDAAVERGIHGVERLVLYKGRPVKLDGKPLYEREYSDQLLIQLLRRFKPQEYRENVRHEHSGSIDIIERLQAARKRLMEFRAKESG